VTAQASHGGGLAEVAAHHTLLSIMSGVVAVAARRQLILYRAG
jgi:hypothetical protein